MLLAKEIPWMLLEKEIAFSRHFQTLSGGELPVAVPEAKVVHQKRALPHVHQLLHLFQENLYQWFPPPNAHATLVAFLVT